MDNEEFTKSAINDVKEMFSIITGVAEGTIDGRDAVKRITAITTKTTLDGLDAARAMGDDIAADFASGNFTNMVKKLQEWNTMVNGVSRSILLQMEQNQQFGIDGLGGLDGL